MSTEEREPFDIHRVVDMASYRPKRNEMVWECRCGGQLFYLCADSMEVECKSCKQVMTKLVWGERK